MSNVQIRRELRIRTFLPDSPIHIGVQTISSLEKSSARLRCADGSSARRIVVEGGAALRAEFQITNFE